MGVTTRDQQSLVWRTLTRLDYRGVVTVHAETESRLHPERWDPSAPISHGASRPVEAEVHSVRQQIELALEAGFRGSLHIAHVTTPEVLDIIAGSRSELPFALCGGVTPHHALLDEAQALDSTVPEWRVNPPLRPAVIRDQLRGRVEAGAIDWIESDHAPHTWRDKTSGAAGLPGIPAFRLLRDRLRAKLPEREVDRLTHAGVLEAFQLPTGSIPKNPYADAPWEYVRAAREYPWDPYRSI